MLIELFTSPRAALLLTTAVGSVLIAGTAAAQNSAQADSNQLEEVVVTATRQADTVNRVPLAVTAQTQRALDQQGVRTVRDLENLVPSLNTTQSLASGASQFSIRGVGFLGSGQAGAAPVGFYLDDSPIQKRNVGGGVATSNGTPLPPLFDLERVEVLRGPQGTLFGSGSEGGTIRYIQPQPSLTRYSSYARMQYSTPKKGEDSYEAGVAVGGPIIQDKLGFRASVYARNTGGFIDMIDPLTKQEWAHDTGDGKIRMMRGALTWSPVPNARITFDFFSSRDETDNNTSTYNLDVPAATTVPTLCFNTNNTPLSNFGGPAGVNRSARGGPVGSLPPGSGGRTNPYPVARGDAACATLRAAGDVTYTLPGFTYGPYDVDRYDRIAQNLEPSATNLQIASLTVDYEFGKASVRSITTYIDDQTKTVAGQTTPFGGYRSNATYNDPVTGRTFTQANGPAFNPIFDATKSANVTGNFISDNRRYGITQEVRFSSLGDARPFSWVAGVFFSNIRGTQHYDAFHPLEYVTQRLYGITEFERYGAHSLPSSAGVRNIFDAKDQQLKDIEVAAFAEGNYWITDKLRATVGLRIAHLTFDYHQTFVGPVQNTDIPTEENGGINGGHTAESPVNPKFGLQYQITDNDMVYVTAAKGFRAGGVNSEVSYGICATALDAIGYKPNDLPLTYKSDSVWSYEGGAKLRLLNNRLQVNGAVYRIDWKNPQYTTNPGSCGLITTFNVPSARSEGVEVEAQARLFRGLTVNGSFGYTDSKYLRGLVFPAGKPLPENNFNPVPFTVVLKGQKIPIPPYTVSAGARYDVGITSTARAYARVDYRWSKGYSPNPFPVTSYTPDSAFESTQTTNFRFGVEYGDFDINLFVNNAFDRKSGVRGGGRSQCLAAAAGGTAACTTYAAYNPLLTINTGPPREFGLQIAYRH